jgi:REP element-mobilizing transposase RayT
MADTYIGLYIHYVFSTKNREPIIATHVQERIWAFMGGIARENRMKALCIGGVADHVHLLISMPTTISVAKTMQLIKGGTTAWVHDTFPGQQHFAWQEGYGVFSVSECDLEQTIAYINRQEEHHRRKTFQEEYLELLKENGVEYDEKYLWD